MAGMHVLTFDPLVHILKNLREADRREIEATRWWQTPEEHAASIVALGEFSWIFHANDGEPTYAIGAYRMWPGVCTLWAFGTDRTPEVIRAVTKHAARFMVPVLKFQQGFHRAECRSIADRNDVGAWLNLLGLKREAVLSGFGSGREDFVLYAWTADDPGSPNTH